MRGSLEVAVIAVGKLESGVSNKPRSDRLGAKTAERLWLAAPMLLQAFLYSRRVDGIAFLC